MEHIILGIDIGGTSIKAGVLVSGHLQDIRSMPTPALESQEVILEALATFIESYLPYSFEGIGIGIPGLVNPKEGVVLGLANIPSFQHVELRKFLTIRFGKPVFINNDANCFALAETHLGAVLDVHPGAEIVFGVIMGTGVGGGLVAHGKVVKGVHGIGGEWGHNILEEDGDPCYCGKAGCVEKVIAGPSLELFYERQTGEKKKLKDIVQAYIAGSDLNATATMERLFEYYGKAISTIINVIDPDVIVIGGGVGNIDLLYSEGYERIKKYIFNSGEVLTPIVKPKLGDSAGVFGAAML